MHITDAQLATYKEQGFLIVENFLTKDEQQAALDGFFTHFAPPYDQYLPTTAATTPLGKYSSLGITPASITSRSIPI